MGTVGRKKRGAKTAEQLAKIKQQLSKKTMATDKLRISLKIRPAKIVVYFDHSRRYPRRSHISRERTNKARRLKDRGGKIQADHHRGSCFGNQRFRRQGQSCLALYIYIEEILRSREEVKDSRPVKKEKFRVAGLDDFVTPR